jgi:hypothetical protein
MHPYRKHQPTHVVAPAGSEELIVYVALCVVGAIPVAVAISRGGAFGVEPTLGLAMILAGAAGVIARATGCPW